MSAEAIARVVADIKAGRINPTVEPYNELIKLNKDTVELSEWATVIDATPVWEQFQASAGGSAVYEDHLLRPVWNNALVCYENSFGNVNVISVRVVDLEGQSELRLQKLDRWSSMSGTHEIDWDRVKWVFHAVLYLGGRGGGQPAPTAGPVHCWRIAIYPDGEIADVNWIQVHRDAPVEQWNTQMMVLLDTYNLGNCVNVELAEPHRPRAQARRLARTGVTVSEIHVRPVSKSYRGKGTPLSQLGSSPLTSVRGHMASYGPEYGRGLLFGKYSGRFWIPQHARGAAENGVVEQRYVAQP